MSIKYVLYFLDNINGSLLNNFERREIGKRKTKNTIVSKTFGITNPNNCVNFIHAHSIFLLKNKEKMPRIPTTKDTMIVHCHEKII
jgi:hypothetical protein